MKEYKVVFWILRKIRCRIPMLTLLLIANAGTALFGVLFALGTRGIIDSAVDGKVSAFFNACLLQAAIIGAMLLCALAARYLKDRFVTELDRDLKKSLLEHLLRGEYAQVCVYHSGELVNRLNNDMRILNDGIVSIVPGLIAIIVQLVAAFVVLFSVAPGFTAVLCAGGALAVLGTGILRRALKALNKRISVADGKVFSFIQEALERLLVVQAMDLGGEVERRAGNLLQERLELQRHRRRISLMANTGVAVLYYVAGFAALVWCAVHLLQGSMSFGTLTAVTQLVSQLQTPFVNISGIIPQYAAMIAAAERLQELEQIPEYPQEKTEDLQAMYEGMESIGGEGICFSYEEEDVLYRASFTLPKGSFATITGASGIGKSTLLKLMMGVFAPAAGTFYVQRNGVRTELARNTKGLFTYVPQGNLLFSGSVRENLLIGSPDADQAKLEEAIYVSCMDQFLEQLPEGLDTAIGENGTGLSEGQAQRLAIARAVLSDAPIILLDEATSALDVDVEHTVLERIAQMPNRTCIIVSHRPAALQLSDWQLEIVDKTIHVHKLKP